VRVLIADDEATSRHLIHKTLEGWGFEVLLAVDGSEALRTLENATPPEIALLDWMMPKVDGLEVCRRIRDAKLDAPTYIILYRAS
jgi:CheY-like chemotaxis protein